jgi:hypothetical protein
MNGFLTTYAPSKGDCSFSAAFSVQVGN